MCTYGIDAEIQFEESWSVFLVQYNVHEKYMATYRVNEKWIACYMKKAFMLGTRSTQLNERINYVIKSCMKPKYT